MKTFESQRKLTPQKFASELLRITGNKGFSEVKTYDDCVNCIYETGNLVLPFNAEDLVFIEQRYPVYGGFQGSSKFKDMLLDAWPMPIMIMDSLITGNDRLIVAQIALLDDFKAEWMLRLKRTNVTVRPLKVGRQAVNGESICVAPVSSFVSIN